MDLKRALRTYLPGIVAVLTLVFTMGATSRPNQGGLEGGGFRVKVTDTSPDSVVGHELLTQGGFNFSQMTSNATLRAWFDTTAHYAAGTSATDTVTLHLTGIGTDSTYVDTTLVIGAGDTLTTARTFFMWESAYLDTAVGGVMRIWPTGGAATTPLDTIPAWHLDWPMAHRLFGKRDAPLLTHTIFQWLGRADTLAVELRYYPNLANYRVKARKDSVGHQYEVINNAWLYKGDALFVDPEDKLMGSYSALAAFARTEDVPAGLTAAVTFTGRRTR